MKAAGTELHIKTTRRDPVRRNSKENSQNQVKLVTLIVVHILFHYVQSTNQSVNDRKVDANSSSEGVSVHFSKSEMMINPKIENILQILSYSSKN
jgi:hypothetical protein